MCQRNAGGSDELSVISEMQGCIAFKGSRKNLEDLFEIKNPSILEGCIFILKFV
jgi:hypothetical protein